ncbi:MAG: acyl-CoA thioesterase II [Moheibacter sp.]
MKNTQELIDLIHLKQIDARLFTGKSESVGSTSVFGGQVLAQALNAAYRTVSEERFCHSLHGYFILPGDLEKDIVYKVQLVRDGGSFTTRYVSAEQDGVSIFVLAASFQKEEPGYDFQQEMPEVPSPDSLLSWEDIYEQTKSVLPARFAHFLSLERPVIFKPTVVNNPFEKVNLEPIQHVWFQIKEMNPEISVPEFQEILAYVSDYNILVTALQPHASKAHFGNTQMASLDHAMWFHRKPEDFSGWFLYSIEVPSTSNARGLTTGKIFSQDGNLIASIAQEGLMRPKNP